MGGCGITFSTHPPYLYYITKASVYYKIKQQRRAISEEEQQDIRLAFTEMGYDGNAIEFDHYEEQYPAIMRIVKY